MKKTAIALLVALSLLAAIPVAPALGLSRTACRVKNADSGVTKRSLQAAVKAAKGGHHLTVRGVCHGTTTVGKNLTISGIKPKGANKPKLDGDQKGTVVTIPRGRRVLIRRLVITDGSGSGAAPDCSDGDTCGGGIWNHGTLRLSSVRVTGNTANWGGGVFNSDEIVRRPKLTLLGTTSVSGNNAINFGGGIYNYLGTITLKNSSRIVGNIATGDGGGVYNDNNIDEDDDAILKLLGSSRISGNTARRGGGVGNTGILTLYHSSQISGNTANEIGGGVFNRTIGILTLHGSSQVTANTAADEGGGVYNDGLFDTSQCGPGKRVHDNIGGDC